MPVILALVLLLLTVALLFFRSPNSGPRAAIATKATPPDVAPETNDAAAPEVDTGIPAVPPPPAALPAPPQRVRALVSNLILMDPRKHEFPPEMIPWWQRHFQALKETGPDGAAAIVEFLARNEDVVFEGIHEYRQIGYPTLRVALIDALRAMGGQTGIDAQRQVLGMASLPAELVALAQNLEQSAPRRYRAEILDATRAVLAQAQAGELPGYNVGPLFQLLIRYAGTNAVADLQITGGKWKYYTAIALARLPRGAGVPSLVEWARSAGHDTVAVWPLLAEHAGKSEDARGVLLEAARAGRLPSAAWPELARALGGYEHHVSALPSTVPASVSYDKAIRPHLSNTDEQIVAVLNLAPLSAAELNVRLDLVEQLAALNPPDAAALANARELLAKELKRKRR